MFAGKNVFISGGTGYLGSAICELFSEYGAHVYFSYYKNEEQADKLIKSLSNTDKIQVNLKDIKDIKNKINDLYEKIEKIDILVNNAGISQVMPFSMLEPDDLDLLYDVNMKGMFFLTKAVVRGMIRQKSGTIVNIGSIAGQRILDVPVHYALTKSSVSGFTYALASELKRFSIRVNSVCPGMLEDGVSRGIPDELKEVYLKHCTVGRPGAGKEVAEVVCFLASDKASYINGQNIFVDGGI